MPRSIRESLESRPLSGLVLALNNCADVVDVFEVGLADKCGEAEIVLADFLAGGTVGNATIASRELYGPQFSRAMVRLETLDHFGLEKVGSMLPRSTSRAMKQN